MADNPAKRDRQSAEALRGELRVADDHKIKRIAAMMDEVSDTPVKQAIMDPLRSRLGSLNTVRPLRFERLLFTPFDPLIVPANQWKPGDAAVPRSVLTTIGRVVRAGLGAEAGDIERRIARQKADAIQVVTSAGQILWPRAAEILAGSDVPADWAETGLRPAVYAPLVQAIAAVLRRAPRLRSLLRTGEVGAMDVDDDAIDDILRGIASEPAEGCAMVTQLILRQSPHAVPLLRQLLSARQNSPENAQVYKALARGSEQALTWMEGASGVVHDINSLPLSGIGDHLRRVGTLLGALADDATGNAQRPRIKAIRAQLDETCRTRFADEMQKGIVTPLVSASGALMGPVQSDMEQCARDLRCFEAEIRKAGAAGGYEQMLQQASESVFAAEAAGALTPVRTCRLIEILSGPEAATAHYRKAVVAR